MEQQLSSLISQLFQGKNVKQVNEAIHEISKTKECWHAALGLLSSSEVYVRFFCANMIYNKIRRDCTQLTETERQEVFAYLFKILSHATSEIISNDYQVFLNRIILSVIVLSFRIPDGLRVYLQSANEAVSSSIANKSMSSAAISLRLLISVPEELEASDISSDLRSDLSELLTQFVETLFSSLDGLCSGANRELVLLILASARTWCSLGMNLTTLHTSHNATFQLLLQSLQAADSQQVLECWSFLQELVVVSEYPRSAQRSQIMGSFLQLVSQSAARLDLSDSNISTSLCNLLVSIASVELSSLVREEPSTTGFFRLLLSVVQLRPRRLLMLTFDLWVEVQDTSLEDIHPCVRGEVVQSLLGVIVQQCRHTPEVEQDEEEEEDWQTLRDPRLGLSDVLGVCHFALGSTLLFQSLYQLLPPVVPSTGSGVDLSQHSSASQLEAVLFVVTQLDTLKTTLETSRSSGGGVSQTEADLILSFLYELTARCLSLSETQYQTCGGGQPMANALKETVCRYLGALTFLLTKSTSLYLGREVRQLLIGEQRVGGVIEMRDLLVPSLQFLLGCISSTLSSVSSAAAKALHQLLTHGLKWLTSRDQLPLLQSMCVLFGQYIQSGAVVFLDSLLLLTESLVRCVVSIRHCSGGSDGSHPSSSIEPNQDPQSVLFNLLTEPLVVSLISECSSGNMLSSRVYGHLSLISQVIRFCDAPVVDTAHSVAVGPSSDFSSLILLPFLQRVWPLLEQIGAAIHQMDKNPVSCSNNSSSSILSVVFEIFGRVFTSLGPLALTQSERVAHLVLAVLSTRGSSSCPAALKCSSVLVEYFVAAEHSSSLPSHYSGFLPSLLSGIVDAFYHSYHNLRSTAASVPGGTAVWACLQCFNNDLDCIQEFFSFVYGFLVFSPSTLLQSSSVVPRVMELLLLCLEGCTEREPLRVILQVVQCGFCPPSQHHSPSLLRNVSDQFLCFGEPLVHALLRLISQGSIILSLASSVAEALLSVIAGCSSDAQLALCQGWFGSVIVSDPSAFARLESSETRQLTLSLLFHFARQNSRRFKVLVQDVMKICASELTVDALMAYSDVLAR